MTKILTSKNRAVHMLKPQRNRRGNTIIEAPGVLYFLFFLVAFPMIAIATMTIRGVFFLYACRDATNQAAKCASYSANNTTIVPNTISATNTAASVFATDVKAWSGISGTLSLQIIAKPVTGGTAPPPSTGKLTTLDLTNNIYFIRGTGLGQIQPLFPLNLAGYNVPGMTGPYPLTIIVESYVENPQGLTN
jgi:hypothetical protein